jgi:hypothetical protein
MQDASKAYSLHPASEPKQKAGPPSSLLILAVAQKNYG